MIAPCESVLGEWGQVCPDCGQRLPTAKPWGEGRPCNRASLAEIGKGRKSDEARLRQLREAQRRHRARPR